MADRSRQKYFGKRSAWLRWRAYAQLSSLVGYLIGKYGTAPFHAIYNRAVEDIDFEAAYGLSEDQLIAAWVSSIGTQTAPSEQAQRVYNLLIQNIKNSL